MKNHIIFIFIWIIAIGFLSAGTITLISPMGGEVLETGNPFQIKWSASGTKNPFKITLWRNNTLIGLIDHGRAGNGQKILNWKAGHLANGKSEGRGPGYTIKVKEKSTTAAAVSKNFSIRTKSKSLAIKFPNGGGMLSQNSKVTITWSSSSLTAPLSLELWKGNRKYGTIVSGISPSSTRYEWNVGHTFGNAPAGAGIDYRIRITGDELDDISDRYFSITTRPSTSVNNNNNLINK